MMDVAFKIRRADIKKFIALAERKEPPKDEDWLVYMNIGECVGRFEAAGSFAEYPVHGILQGLARYPLGILRRVMRRRGPAELEIGFSEGIAVWGKDSESSRLIEIGMMLDKRSGRGFYPTQLDLLAIARTLSKEAAVELGVDRLLDNAESRMRDRVGDAKRLLGIYGVAGDRVDELVEQATSSEVAQARIKVYLSR